jgi:hypothetical protein
MALEPATEEVLAAMPDAVQPSRGRGKPGEQGNHAARVLFRPRIQLPGHGDLGPLIVGRKSQRFGETQRIGLSPVSGMSGFI